MSLWRPVLSSMLLHSGEAGWGWWIPTDSTNRFQRPVMLWEWSVTLWRWCQRGRCWLKYGQSQTASHTHFVMCWSGIRVLSVRDLSRLSGISRRHPGLSAGLHTGGWKEGIGKADIHHEQHLPLSPSKRLWSLWAAPSAADSYAKSAEKEYY